MRRWLLVVTADVGNRKRKRHYEGFLFLHFHYIPLWFLFIFAVCVGEMVSPAGFTSRTLNVEADINAVSATYNRHIQVVAIS